MTRPAPLPPRRRLKHSDLRFRDHLELAFDLTKALCDQLGIDRPPDPMLRQEIARDALRRLTRSA